MSVQSDLSILDDWHSSIADSLSSVPMQLRYDVALLYLKQANYDLNLAIESYLADEQWEKEHPIEGSSKNKTKQNTPNKRLGLATGLSGQL